MDDNVRQQLVYEANRKSAGVSYLLWFFFGGFGAHRFYLGRHVSAVLQLALCLFGWMPLFIGWAVLGAWWLLDAFLIPGIVRHENLKTIEEIGSDQRPLRLEDDRDYRPARPLPR